MRYEMSNTPSDLHRCKTLAKKIKMQRSPRWPLAPTAVLPAKDVTDMLVKCYLRTIESVYRILHIPSFEEEHTALWVLGAAPDPAFIVQLKLVLAIGAIFYNEQFSLRVSAIQWVREAQTWLSQPLYKSRLTIQSLQTNLLFLFARNMLDVGGELVWISAGSLFRTAVHMGLHRDPASLSNMPPLESEMRRRLWNTILELTLQSSMDSGGLPFVSVDDFDTAAPGNFDDQQLMTDDAAPEPETVYTQSTIAIGLRKSLALRLTVARSLNDIGEECSYDETLRLYADLKAAYRTLCLTLQICNADTERSPFQFKVRVVHIIMCRYLSSLHIPFFTLSLHEAAYAFSRNAVIETAFKIWANLYPSSSPISTSMSTQTYATGEDDLARLVVCGSGFLPSVILQASFVIAVELRAQLRDNEGLGPAPIRQDLLSLLEQAKALTLRCVEAGETNIKNYLLLSVVLAQIDCLMRGIPDENFPQLLIDTAKAAVATCLSILEGKAVQFDQEAALEGGGPDAYAWNAISDFMDDWDFMVRANLCPYFPMSKLIP
jgi:hypothetical protein